ncbi:hypothetical protein JG687_00008880 [Phytophthora cactorum]|uniref:Uncharacterized protein n=1 Tax=Phytophthora cactorum TaxID=29920 RepID=A0A329T0Z2_9STRA|nr:hypothetical protein Pcac1_g17497 [Phytophthora cactorum]KAG2828197.1 hypothetical protein PC112_g8552 [Phytophthora cactorum]KAG2863665.1 hypothetical protein PC113_g5253 [Phytophthora cactorum]KAG2926821.1 hypothetical protein PC115_g7784 [Phytophthora cactorum]KAG2942652.1 hypothetical protein PC117_g9700 [Phytophthora cactorum]
MKGAKAHDTRAGQPALSILKGQGITVGQIATTLKQAAGAAGLDARLFSTPSVRIGEATVLMNSGDDHLVIKFMDRWLSSAYKEYPVLTADGSSGLAKLMCGMDTSSSSTLNHL